MVVTIATVVASAINLTMPIIGISWSEIIRNSPLTFPAVRFDQLDSVPPCCHPTSGERVRAFAHRAAVLWAGLEYGACAASASRSPRRHLLGRQHSPGSRGGALWTVCRARGCRPFRHARWPRGMDNSSQAL